MKLYLVTHLAKNKADCSQLMWGGSVVFGDNPDDAWFTALGRLIEAGINYNEWEDWRYEAKQIDPKTIILAARDIEY